MCNSNHTVRRVIYFQDVLEVDRSFRFEGRRDDLIRLLTALAKSPAVIRNSVEVVAVGKNPYKDDEDGADSPSVAPANTDQGGQTAVTDSLCGGSTTGN